MKGNKIICCFFFIWFLTGYLKTGYSQKPPVDFSTKDWEAIGMGNETISHDGNYISYFLYNQPAGSRKLIIQSFSGHWKKELTGINRFSFSNNSKLAILNVGTDSICLLELGTDNVHTIAGIVQYSIAENGDWIIYHLASSSGDIDFHNLATGETKHFSGVSYYRFAKNGKKLLMQFGKDSISTTVQLFDLQTGRSNDIWVTDGKEETVGGYSFDEDQGQLAFEVKKQQGNQLTHVICYYKPGMNKAVMLVNNGSAGIEQGLEIAGGVLIFNKEGNRLFFELKKRETVKKDTNSTMPGVDIWSYRDLEIQSAQQKGLNEQGNETYQAVIDLNTTKVVRLSQQNERIVSGHIGDYLLIAHSQQQIGYTGSFEYRWNIAARPSYYLVSVKDGSRKLLFDHPKITPAMSPTGKWIIYYDTAQRNFFTYEVATGQYRNITKGANCNWLDQEDERPDTALAWVPWRNTWLAGDNSLLIFDTYDIWEIDPAGIKPPLNLTNGYGERNHIKFQLMDEGQSMNTFSVKERPLLILNAVNESNKDRGFYSKLLGSKGDPQLCFMGPFVFGGWDGDGSYNFPPVKARDADKYLTVRMSAVEHPNFFTTADFKDFIRLTDIQPQTKYNWFTTELIHFKTLDGSMTDGILYKPENFDSTKKYPVIIHYYEKHSLELNLYKWPESFTAQINIPWFVSHGYLVFVPDIHYKLGYPGQSACNSIIAAGEYMAGQPWVDSAKMGIQGHSFGGFETGYVVTHSHLFAAACAASGIYDLMGFYGADARGSYGKHWSEDIQGRIGATPWQRPDLYISNSSVFNADKVTTPLLMMHNKADDVVPFSQGLEFFSALRRLGKTVWMLQYDKGRHSVDDPLDYTTRVIQFFDHYLKGAPAPKWMVEGIPAAMKNIDSGIELEPVGIEPGPGLLEIK